jgi:hypothetical protein
MMDKINDKDLNNGILQGGVLGPLIFPNMCSTSPRKKINLKLRYLYVRSLIRAETAIFTVTTTTRSADLT